jgi:DNA-binding NarL/FixJ family response regulator
MRTAESIIEKIREAESSVIAARHELKDAEARVSRLKCTLAAVASHGSAISAQKLRIISLVRQGKQNKEIANELHVCVQTIKFHLNELFHKFGVSNRMELAIATASLPIQIPSDNPKIVTMRSA